MKYVALYLLLAIHSTSWGSVYYCSSPNSKPSVSRSSKLELNVFTYNSDINPTELNATNLRNKSPYLIYYAVDSNEALMQYSVRFEVAKLQQACRKNSNVKFVAFLNSLYVENNSFILCKDKHVSVLSFKSFPKLNKRLIEKRKYISNVKQSDSEYGPLDYLVGSTKNKVAFWNYPLAHPDFLHDLLKLTISEKSLFPINDFGPFISLKSHGSKTHVLAGMHKCQEKAKEQSSKKIIESVLSRNEITFLRNLESIDSVEKNIVSYEQILKKLDLGEISESGSSIGNKDLLGHHRLSSIETNAYSSLGVDMGLGSEHAFGTDHANLGWIIRDIFESGSEKSIGFLMLESCETNRNPHLYHSYISNVYAYYTARKSLWYRNLNWWKILEKSEGLTVNMVNILQEETSKIPNIEVVNN